MMGFGTLLRRDLALLLPGGTRGGAILPLIFFLAVAMLFPFAVGPDAALLARTGGGVLWVAALLAAILPLDRLVAADLGSGIFDQLALRGISEEAIMASRLLAHWLAFAPLLLVACFPAAALLGLSGETVRLLLLGLLAGTPGLAAIGLMVASLMASLRAGAALAGLMLLPLAVPILIFGAGSLSQGDNTGIALAGAISLTLCGIAPFAAGAAIRAARES
ncbi:heme exporter protein CcmB [Parerythrobacter jejuensis]|uniref:Heme exporter protein B n=1 Tax=Parerythrobacter jejuensis TaxID=795812 RepID=A0A845AQE7_9SPHN|nr:heme exporter protein CcmB [Parerythrobacter jejuensis]MXP31627.1 heme ABC transporter permease CcmB [Parerythrobacter jejuensis]